MIDSMDRLVAAMTGPRHKTLWFTKLTTTAVAARAVDMWKVGGSGFGLTPQNAGEYLDHTNLGALMTLPQPDAGEKLYLSKFEIFTSQGLTAYLMDRIWHGGSLLNPATSTEQAVNSPPLPPRAADGAGVEVWLTAWSAVNNAMNDITLNYTNQDGVAKSAVTPGAGYAMPINVTQRLQLAPGDTGVQSVQSVQWPGNAGTGSMGIVLAKRIADAFTTTSTVSVLRDVAQLGMPEIAPDACLSMIGFASTTTTGDVVGHIAVTAG